MTFAYLQYPCYTYGKPTTFASSLFTARFLQLPQSCEARVTKMKFCSRVLSPQATLDSKELNVDVDGNDTSASTSKSNSNSNGSGVLNGKAAKGSGTTARGRRLLRVREEKRKREYDKLHTYPAWAKVLEEACQHDLELRAVLGDSIGNPELMRKRVEERVLRKGRDFQRSKTGSVLAFKVSFRE